MNHDVAAAMNNWFRNDGAYVLVDGQWGSTGKGVIAAAMAECFADRVDTNITNAAPNSGHTFYTGAGKKVVLKQLPTFAVASMYHTHDAPRIAISGGAAVDFDTLGREVLEHKVSPPDVHPFAAVIGPEEKSEDTVNVKRVASTGQGVGPAFIRKMQRGAHRNQGSVGYDWSVRNMGGVVFFEVSQGFSLGINSGHYPWVTSRECTVSQALADAGFPPNKHRKTVMSLRSLPIRVGNTEGTSGPCYPDQRELTWEEVGQEPELTTVTKRVRRIFTWSNTQFIHAIKANCPDVLFLNFMNYVPEDDRPEFLDNVVDAYRNVLGRDPVLLLGWGPKSSDITLYTYRVTSSISNPP